MRKGALSRAPSSFCPASRTKKQGESMPPLRSVATRFAQRIQLALFSPDCDPTRRTKKVGLTRRTVASEEFFSLERRRAAGSVVGEAGRRARRETLPGQAVWGEKGGETRETKGIYSHRVADRGGYHRNSCGYCRAQLPRSANARQSLPARRPISDRWRPRWKVMPWTTTSSRRTSRRWTA